MINKFLFLISFFLISCFQNKPTETQKVEFKLGRHKNNSGCTYDYFTYQDGQIDSLLVECPDVKPPKPSSS